MFCKKSQESATLPSKSVAQMATVVEQEHKTRYWGYLPQGLARTILKIIYIENIEATENIEVIENIEMFSNLYLPRFQFSHTNLSYNPIKHFVFSIIYDQNVLSFSSSAKVAII